jgi:hypothetical protein
MSIRSRHKQETFELQSYLVPSQNINSIYGGRCLLLTCRTYESKRKGNVCQLLCGATNSNEQELYVLSNVSYVRQYQTKRKLMTVDKSSGRK